jgi:hypothetical protein
MACPDPGRVEGATEAQRKMHLTVLTEKMVDFALKLRPYGVQFVGTAPGSTPVYSGSISAVVSDLDVITRREV